MRFSFFRLLLNINCRALPASHLILRQSQIRRICAGRKKVLSSSLFIRKIREELLSMGGIKSHSEMLFDTGIMCDGGGPVGDERDQDALLEQFHAFVGAYCVKMHEILLILGI
jgi:hypothetical protein